MPENRIQGNVLNDDNKHLAFSRALQRLQREDSQRSLCKESCRSHLMARKTRRGIPRGSRFGLRSSHRPMLPLSLMKATSSSKVMMPRSSKRVVGEARRKDTTHIQAASTREQTALGIPTASVRRSEFEHPWRIRGEGDQPVRCRLRQHPPQDWRRVPHHRRSGACGGAATTMGRAARNPRGRRPPRPRRACSCR